MAEFLDTRGQPTLGIGICDRCHQKFPLAELIPDGNSPGLRVCRKDWDSLDPYRLPPRQPDKITLPFIRPDVTLDGFQDPFELPGDGYTFLQVGFLADGFLAEGFLS